MLNMFTTIGKVFLVVLSIVVVITSIMIGADAGAGYGWLTLLAGILVLLIFGMWVELCDNVKNIKGLLKILANNSYGNGAPGGILQSSTENSITNSSYDSGWTCSYCGTKNSSNSDKCCDCNMRRMNAKGNSKLNLSQVAAQADREKKEQTVSNSKLKIMPAYQTDPTAQANSEQIWYCRFCGYGNKGSNRSGVCKSCGKQA